MYTLNALLHKCHINIIAQIGLAAELKYLVCVMNLQADLDCKYTQNQQCTLKSVLVLL